MIYRRYIKRLLDVVLSLAALVLLSPLLLLLALLVRFRLGSPVLFKQPRPGLNERIFTMYKFRTMTDTKDEDGQMLPDADRLAPFGRWLRSTSLDELPELINVLKGEMSIVGPRPLLVAYLPRYTTSERRRHEVRPGITGLSQVNGRNMLPWEERFVLDVKYIDKISLSLDIQVIVQTSVKVLKREGINSAEVATMEYFCGTAENEAPICAK